MNRRMIALALLVGIGMSAGPASAAGRRRSRRPAAVPQSRLVWYAESASGRIVGNQDGDVPINPASVVKVATSLWALERLGPEYRFETRVFARGTVDAASRRLNGDLLVRGGFDPDFQLENAFLLASALNDVGVDRVTGSLIVTQGFWLGFENGSEGTNPDPEARGRTMAARLRQAMDPSRWNGQVRAAWREFAARRGYDRSRPPRVRVGGGIGYVADARESELLVVHRSEPLVDVLRRFDTYSNNDIERLGAVLGRPSDLAGILNVRLTTPDPPIELETLSGLGTNRITPRQIVAILREFRHSCERLGLTVSSVLPVSGCDEGTVTRFFPQLASGDSATAVVGKTGTLTSTDGGVSVLAGFAGTGDDEIVFCVAMPRAGGRLHSARRALERWVLELVASHGGPRPRPCDALVPMSDMSAHIIRVARSDVPRVGGGAAGGR